MRAARRQAQALDRAHDEQPPRAIERAIRIDLRRGERRIEFAGACELCVQRRCNPGTHFVRVRVGRRWREQHVAVDIRDHHAQVDSVEQRTRNAAAIAALLIDRADAIRRGAVASRGTRIHRRDQLEARRITDSPGGARQFDHAAFERLPQRLEHASIELGQFVEEQHAAMRERNLARPRRPPAAADQCGRRRGVVRRAQRARTVKELRIEAAVCRVDAYDLERIALGQRRQQAARVAPRASSCRCPGGPVSNRWCPPAAAIVSARFAAGWPLTSARSSVVGTGIDAFCVVRPMSLSGEFSNAHASSRCATARVSTPRASATSSTVLQRHDDAAPRFAGSDRGRKCAAHRDAVRHRGRVHR